MNERDLLIEIKNDIKWIRENQIKMNGNLKVACDTSSGNKIRINEHEKDHNKSRWGFGIFITILCLGVNWILGKL